MRAVSMRILWWSVAKRSATMSDCSGTRRPRRRPPPRSRWRTSARPCWPASASSPTIRLESRPPESRQPTGTSATRRRSTAVRSDASTASAPVALGPVGLAGIALVAGRPVGALDPAAVGLDGQRRRRGELAHAGEDGARRRHDGVEAEVVVQRHGVDRRVDASARQQRRQRGGEAQRPLHLREVERLDAEAVARQHHAARVTLGDAQGEHAVEALDEGVAPLGVRPQQHLGVAAVAPVVAREEAVPPGLELAAQLAVVVDAAVEDDRHAELGVEHGLGGGLGEVDDRQAAVAHGDVTVLPEPPGIGTPVPHGLGHGRHQDGIGRARGMDLSAEAAHGIPVYPKRAPRRRVATRWLTTRAG